MSSYNSYSLQSHSETSIFTEIDNTNEDENEIPKNEFGNFQETYNWMECESVRFPGQIYYFNLRTHDSTWVRPVSRNVRLQRFSRKSKIYDNDLTSDIDIPLLLLSESEEENIDNEQNEQTNKGIYKNSEILARLYYGTSMDQFCNNNENQCFIDCFNDVVKNSLCNKDCSDFHDSSFHEATEKETGCDKSIDENSNLSIIASNFLEVELSTSETKLNFEENIELTNKDDTPATGKSLDYSTSSTDEEKKENDIRQDYIKPRLKRIKAKYLLQEKLKNEKRRKIKTKRIPLQEIKIVREMYGTTTVSYDPVEPELPPGVKRTNLSDSSTTLSSGYKRNDKTVVSNNTEFLNVDLHVANLSSKSSSITCSSSSCSSSCSCSCSSCSSSTSSKTTNTDDANTLTTGQST